MLSKERMFELLALIPDDKVTVSLGKKPTYEGCAYCYSWWDTYYEEYRTCGDYYPHEMLRNVDVSLLPDDLWPKEKTINWLHFLCGLSVADGMRYLGLPFPHEEGCPSHDIAKLKKFVAQLV